MKPAVDECGIALAPMSEYVGRTFTLKGKPELAGMLGKVVGYKRDKVTSRLTPTAGLRSKTCFSAASKTSIEKSKLRTALSPYIRYSRSTRAGPV